MPQLNIAAAFDYYDKHINRTERFDILEKHDFSIVGSVPSIDWELFGALLTGDTKKTGYGSDLKTFEVKSAVEENGFEYQYHKHGGLAKLDEDKTVNHVFVLYARDYKTVTVRVIKGSKLADTFESWRPGYIKAYQGVDDPKQRYRKSISHGRVLREGEVVMLVQGGKLIISKPSPDDPPDAPPGPVRSSAG